MHHRATTRDKIILSGVCDNVLFGKLARTDGDKIEVLRPFMTSSLDCQRPTRFTVCTSFHCLDRGIEAKQTRCLMLVRIGMQIGMDLGAFGPFRVIVRHRMIGIAIQIFWRLGLHVRI